MPSIRETILSALHALLQPNPHQCFADEVLPERVPAEGLLILRDGDPGEPAVTLSPLRYQLFRTGAEVEAVVQAGTGRDVAFDALAAGVGNVVSADRTMGGPDRARPLFLPLGIWHSLSPAVSHRPASLMSIER